MLTFFSSEFKIRTFVLFFLFTLQTSLILGDKLA